MYRTWTELKIDGEKKAKWIAQQIEESMNEIRLSATQTQNRLGVDRKRLENATKDLKEQLQSRSSPVKTAKALRAEIVKLKKHLDFNRGEIKKFNKARRLVLQFWQLQKTLFEIGYEQWERDLEKHKTDAETQKK